MDDDIVSAYYDEVDGAAYDNSQGGYTFPCSADLPDFAVGISDYHAVIPGSFMDFSPVSEGSSSKSFARQSRLEVLLTEVIQAAMVVFNQTRALASLSMVISSSRLCSLSSTMTTCNLV